MVRFVLLLILAGLVAYLLALHAQTYDVHLDSASRASFLYRNLIVGGLIAVDVFILLLLAGSGRDRSSQSSARTGNDWPHQPPS